VLLNYKKDYSAAAAGLEKVLEMTGRPTAIIDCFGILNDLTIKTYFELGFEVKGLGRGHIQRIKEEVRNQP